MPPPARKASADAPTAATHSSRRLDLAARAEGAQRSRRECAEDRRESGTFKRPLRWAWPRQPRPPAPPLARFLDLRAGARGGVGREVGRLRRGALDFRTEKQKAGVPPLPAASRARGPLPPAVRTPLLLLDPQFLRVMGVGKGAFRGCGKLPAARPRPLPTGCPLFPQEGPIRGRGGSGGRHGPDGGLPAPSSLPCPYKQAQRD